MTMNYHSNDKRSFELRMALVFIAAPILGIIGLFVIVTIVMAYLTTPDEATRTEVQMDAQPIINALTLYQKENGRYPNNLENLTPKYLYVLPKPPRGAKKWDYYATYESGRNFNLTVVLQREIIDYRTDLKEKWAYRDSSF